MRLSHVEGRQAAGLGGQLLHAPLQLIALPFLALQVGPQHSVGALLLVQPTTRKVTAMKKRRKKSYECQNALQYSTGALLRIRSAGRRRSEEGRMRKKKQRLQV